MRASPKSTQQSRCRTTTASLAVPLARVRSRAVSCLCMELRWAIPVRSAAPTSDEERGGDHVHISPERDAPSRCTARGPWAGNDTSWRNTPQSAMTVQVLSAVLLVCLGLLVGSSWTIQAVQPKLHQQAEQRRRLNEEWSAVRTARRQRGRCPRCGSALSEQDWSFRTHVGRGTTGMTTTGVPGHLTAPRNAR